MSTFEVCRLGFFNFNNKKWYSNILNKVFQVHFYHFKISGVTVSQHRLKCNFLATHNIYLYALICFNFIIGGSDGLKTSGQLKHR